MDVSQEMMDAAHDAARAWLEKHPRVRKTIGEQLYQEDVDQFLRVAIAAAMNAQTKG